MQDLNQFSEICRCEVGTLHLLNANLIMIVVYRSSNRNVDISLDIIERVLYSINHMNGFHHLRALNLHFFTNGRNAHRFPYLRLKIGLNMTITEPTRGNNCVATYLRLTWGGGGVAPLWVSTTLVIMKVSWYQLKDSYLELVEYKLLLLFDMSKTTGVNLLSSTKQLNINTVSKWNKK